MKNKISKITVVVMAFLFVMSLGSTAFAQTEPAQMLVRVSVVEMDGVVAENKVPRGIFGSSPLVSNSDFQKNYLDKGKLVNKVGLVAGDGQTSEYSLGNQIPVVVRTNDVENVEFINAGFSLKATPQIIKNADGKTQTIRLSLELADNEVDSSLKTDIPVVNKRQMQTVITLKYGETVVLGGYTVNGATRYYGISLSEVNR